MSIPRVSIGLPVYNGEKYLRAALNCVLRQDFSNFELIVCDNASTDGTEAICREFAARDARIRYYRNEKNIGATGNYRRVFELARAEFFKWASHDDTFAPTLVRRCLEEFDKAPANTVLVCSRAEIIDDAGQVIDVSADSFDGATANPVRRMASLIKTRQYANPLWGMIRSAALRKTRLMGRFEADHILLLELSLLGGFREIPEILYQQRRHQGSAKNLHLSAKQLLAWHDPSAKAGMVLPHWLDFWVESYRGISHSPLPAGQKFFCRLSVLWMPCWRRVLRWTGPLRARLGMARTSSPTVARGAGAKAS
ncbi:MAG: hypothetical protein RLY20_897 [Verrucomicrobiota bacterium]|jgi:glycosyltransferase involved in cell wall biosynthesis